MMPMETDDMLNFTFTKSAREIVEKAKAKIAALAAKIEERQKRLAELRKEHDIDDSDLVQILTQAREQANAKRFTYNKLSNVRTEGGAQMEERTINAGVVNNFMTESDFIESERRQVKRLELIVRNLKPVPRYANSGERVKEEQEFNLSEEDLTYLGF